MIWFRSLQLQKPLREWFFLGFLLLAVLGVYRLGVENLMTVSTPMFKMFEMDRKRFLKPADQTDISGPAARHLVDRAQRLQDICQTRNHHQRQPNLQQELVDAAVTRIKSLIVTRVYVNREHQLLSCLIPKVGSTFLKKVFRVIDSSNTEKRVHLFEWTQSPHLNIPDSMTINNMTDRDLSVALTSYTKFLFVREPFSRLFSAYVDKIMVPTRVGLDMLEHLRTSSSLNLPECTWKISFADFCSLIYEAQVQGRQRDSHFLPMAYQCDPCLLNFTHVGKMESFIDDISAILQAANVDFADVTGHVEDTTRADDLVIMKFVISRVFGFTANGKRHLSCLKMRELLERVWLLLQTRGFISKSRQLPTDVESRDELIAAAMSAYNQDSLSGAARKKQREEAMMEAYSSVPRDTLDRLSTIFNEDCDLFQYSCSTDRFKSYNSSLFYFQKLY